MGKLFDKIRRVQDKTRPFCSAIVPAAGSSARMGGQDKLLADLYGAPVLMRTLCAIDRTELVDEIIVATGSVPRKMPIPGFDKTMTLTELLAEKKPVGDKVIVFGGGQSGCEAALELVLQGKHPIIVEYANDLIATPGTCLANASFLREMLVFKKVPIYLEHSICEIGDGYVMVKPRSGGDAFKVECDSVVNGLGFRPAPVAPAGKHVRQVGTAAKWGNLRNVIWGAWDVCMKI